MKKVYITLLLSIITFISFSQKLVLKREWVEGVDGYIGDYTAYDEYTVIDKPPYLKHGKFERFWKGGTLIFICHYKNGVLDGEYTYYSTKCSKIPEPYTVLNFKDGLLNGLQKDYQCCNNNKKLKHELNVQQNKDKTWNFSFKLYNCEGRVEEEKTSTTKENELDASFDFEKNTSGYYDKISNSGALKCLMKTFDNNGKILKTEYYENGIKKDPPYYPNGQIKKSGNIEYYENGKIKFDGKKEFYETGKLKSDGKTEYSEDGKVLSSIEWNITKEFFADGKLKSIKNIKTGFFKEWYEDGAILKCDSANETKEYNNKGILILHQSPEFKKQYYESGKIHTEENLKDKTYKEWSEPGQLLVEKTAETETEYYPNGQMKSQKNKTTKVEKEWYDNGVLKKDFNLNAGYCKTYYPGGKIDEETLITSEGLRDGLYTKYDETGKITSQNIYAHNKVLSDAAVIDRFLKSVGEFKIRANVTDSYGGTISRYKPNPEKKILYKKGNAYLTKCHDGPKLALTTQRLISISEKYTEAINAELKKAKTDDDIEGFIFYYDSIPVQSKEITEKLSAFTTSISLEKAVQKAELKEISGLAKTYEKQYYSSRKYNLGKDILGKLNTAIQNMAKISKYNTDIESKRKEFATKYAADKAFKYINKKGQKLLDKLHAQYNAEGNTTKKADFAEKNYLPVLSKFISLPEPATLNSKFKDVSSDEEILKLIGL
ncbi:MAG: hypothetical protein HY958_11340 [Bacteroidia bacterium]|nr:hypothetical protein [Bacteroidia bacterium]